MKRQSILVWFVVLTASTFVYSADWQLDWIYDDNIPPTWSWDIYPSHYPPSSHPPGTVPFSGPTGVFNNSCWAQAALGIPTITIDCIFILFACLPVNQYFSIRFDNKVVILFYR